MTKNSTVNDTSANGDLQTGMMPFRFDLLATMAQPSIAISIAMMTDMNGKLLQGVAASTKEWGDFLNRRLAANMALPQRVAACKTADEMQKVYAEFFKEASAHCRDEVELMTRINMNLTGEAVKAMQRLSKEAPRLPAST
jgi:hypothetical protein